ncbi:MAG: hypothetical protein KGZ82_11580 [Bacteroidales bacterium]|nr:hypothetical protein [Bacteroidales bacterium]
MHPILRNILAVLAGIILGSLVNMGIIMISGAIIPPPEGVDVTNMESLKASMHLFGPQHFIFPWLAHAIGTLAGAVVAALIAAKNKLVFALLVGVFFLMGGIANIFMLPSPLWFSIVDLGGAYLPMGWLGARIASGLTKK